MGKQDKKDVTPAEQLEQLANLDLVLSSTMPQLTRAVARADLPASLKELSNIREAIRRYDALEAQVFQLPAEEG